MGGWYIALPAPRGRDRGWNGIVPRMLLVFGPRSATYDFGPSHPLTPRRFGPGIDLLRSVGAEPGFAPEPAPDEDLLRCHERRYLDAVKRFSASPFGADPRAGIGDGGDDPPFAGMHEAGAMVAGGSMRAIEAVLRGDEEHAFHPGGGLHHAMPDRASGFCIYNDPALAIARARQDGLRVLYVDLDVHHGDGVQAIHWDDPGVLTLSFHESGRFLFPGTGGVGELGEGAAAGTSVNVPMEPGTGEGAWLAAIRLLLPELAAAFGPDLVVSQNGADSHAWDPLAHLRVTTTAMGEAARLVDAAAHRHAGGRWLATGGGGYDAYRVVPRSWSLVWLAGAHREVPAATSVDWRERWAAEAARYGQSPLPETFDDRPNAGLPLEADQLAAEERSRQTAGLVRQLVVPRLLREARDRGWWDPDLASQRRPESQPSGEATVLPAVDAGTWSRLALASRVVAPADVADGHAIVRKAIRAGAEVAAAVAGEVVVGLAIAGPATPDGARDLLAVGVAPAYRRGGLAARLLAESPADRADVTLAERDPVEPLDAAVRSRIASTQLSRAGFTIERATGAVGSADSMALVARRGAARPDDRSLG
jgi:acetoin utilization protein AcuC